jgi:hypothetical protein
MRTPAEKAPKAGTTVTPVAAELPAAPPPPPHAVSKAAINKVKKRGARVLRIFIVMVLLFNK